MPEYLYAAFNTKGKIVRGTIWAATEEEARVQVQTRRYEVKWIRPKIGFLARIERRLAALKPPNLTELAVTTRQLAVMLQAGINIVQALAVLGQQPLGRKLADAWTKITGEVHQGTSLGKSLLKYPELFSGFYVGMVKAGEASGNLASNLDRLADHLEREVALRHKIKSAMTYPMVIFAACLGLAVLIVQHILPQFLNGIFKDSSLTLPWMTRSLIVITAFFNDPKALGTTLAVGAVSFWLLMNHLKTPAGRLQLQQLLLSLPGFRDLVAKSLTTRFCRTMSTLLDSGVPVVQALELCAEAIDHQVLGDYLRQAVLDLRDGNPLHRCVRAIPIFPPLLSGFVELGEESGRTSEMMARLAEVFELELETALITFTQLIEPVMVAVMGFMVGYVLIAIFIPLYQILGNF